MKIKLCGMIHEEKYVCLVISKNKRFFQWFSGLLKTVFNIYYDTYEEYENRKGKWINEAKDIKKCTDKVERVYAGDSGIEVFYGKSKIFIIFHTKKQEKLMKEIAKTTVWAREDKRTVWASKNKKLLVHKK